MSQDSSLSSPRPEQEYLRLWAEAASKVLEQLHGSAVMATPLPDSSASPESIDLPIWVSWKTSGKLSGEQAFQLPTSDAVRLAQMLMQEPVDPTVPLDGACADAFKELLRQFAGLAASACKSKYGHEVAFELGGGSEKPQWAPSFQQSWVLSSPQLTPIHWLACLDSSLAASISSATPQVPEPRPPAVAGAAPAPAGKVAAASAGASQSAANLGSSATVPPDGAALAPTNLDMLLDVELEAILRFGQREMVLRDILELRPGSVIELNRSVSEPAELLVGGRVIARGDVVIVDGSYGLRITEIEHPRQRLESIET
ncbi:MAG TPA: FliM/FliN family flagellar motor switch protein [Candidatus Aquilonibacter sp.]|nr:FliM/FliN family flagellar motor switch protein [Candidatus Aquilonibacter sp.]